MVPRIDAFILTVFVSLHAAAVAADHQAGSVPDILSEYQQASTEFFKVQPSLDERTGFYRLWRDRILESALKTNDPAEKLRGLIRAETISNSMRDYPKSIEIIQAILKTYSEQPSNPRAAEETAYWLVELGEVNQSAYIQTKDAVLFHQAFRTFRDAMHAMAGLPAFLETRVVVAERMGAMVQDTMSPKGDPLNTEADFPTALTAVDWAIEQLQEGFGPGSGQSRPLKRMTKSADETCAQLLFTSALVNVWLGRYDVAERRLIEYSRYEGIPLSTLGVVVEADRSPHLAIRTRAELDAYSQFIDRAAARFPGDREMAEILLIPARRYFRRDELQEAKVRFENIVENHMEVIDASPARLYYLVDIWSALRSIYNRLHDLPRSRDAAQREIEAMEALGQSTAAEKSALEFNKAREAIYVPIAASSPAPNQPFRTYLKIANLVVGIAVVGWLVQRFVRRRN